MKQYGNEVVDAIAARLTQFNGRMVFFDERLEVAREMVAKNLFEPSQLFDTVSQLVADDQKRIECPFDYANFCVDWISQTADSAETLLAIGVDKTLAWYVRREAFRCIGALPDAKQLSDEQWREIAYVVKSKSTTNEIREASLWALVDQGITDVFPIFKNLLEHQLDAQSNSQDVNSWDNATRYLTFASAALGANELIPNVIEPLFADSHYRERDAKRAFKQIVNRMGGIEGVCDELLRQDHIEFNQENRWSQLVQNSNPAVVRWAIRQTSVNDTTYPTMLVSQISNPDWGIRQEACNLIRQAWKANNQFDQQPLWDLFNDKSAEQNTRSWAARTLLLLENSIEDLFPIATREQTKHLWYVPWPFAADQAVRQAVVQEYGFHYRPETDIRYWIESNMFEHYTQEQATADRNLLVNLLVADGLNVTHVKSAADLHAQGWGTYWSIRLGDELNSSEIYVSTLGRIASYTSVSRYKTEKSSGSSWTIGRKTQSFELETQRNEKLRVATIANEVGFVIVEEDLLTQVPPGLNVKFFSNLGTQELSDLIYYWVS